MVAVMAVQLRVLLTSVHGGGEWQVSRKERIDSWDRVLSPPPSNWTCGWVNCRTCLNVGVFGNMCRWFGNVCGCFGNMCTCIYCVFVLFHLCIFVLFYAFVESRNLRVLLCLCIIIIIQYVCLLSQAFLSGTSLEPAVIPTAHASSFTLQYFPYYVWCSKYSCLL